MEFNTELVKRVVRYFNRYHSTTRETARHFGISKTTVHKYLREVMPNEKSATILKANMLAAPHRGGLASGKKRRKKRKGFSKRK